MTSKPLPLMTVLNDHVKLLTEARPRPTDLRRGGRG